MTWKEIGNWLLEKVIEDFNYFFNLRNFSEKKSANLRQKKLRICGLKSVIQ